MAFVLERLLQPSPPAPKAPAESPAPNTEVRKHWLGRALSFRPMEYAGVLGLVLGLAVLLAPVHGMANDWQLLSGDDEVGVFVDRGSIEREGATASAWILKSFSSEVRLGHDLYPHRSQKLQYEFNCTDHTFAVRRWVLTDSAFGHGNPVWGGSALDASSERAPAGSPEARAADLACSGEPDSKSAG